ncbi:hypothetical protein HanIR_Chr02g0081381 [Helianthus annuus]|nr:hypothetical protein HanIR_Chr02g0081381 [Helianthus annuus]
MMIYGLPREACTQLSDQKLPWFDEAIFVDCSGIIFRIVPHVLQSFFNLIV